MTQTITITKENTDLIERVWKYVFGKAPAISTECEGVLIEDFYTLRPIKFTTERVTLRGKKKVEVDGWNLDMAVVIHNYPSEPDDVDIVELGEFGSFGAALTELIQIEARNRVSQEMENIMYEELANQSQKGDNGRLDGGIIR